MPTLPSAARYIESTNSPASCVRSCIPIDEVWRAVIDQPDAWWVSELRCVPGGSKVLLDARAGETYYIVVSFAEELRQELQVRRFTTSGARTREFEQGFEQLRALDGLHVDPARVALGKAEEMLETGALDGEV